MNSNSAGKVYLVGAGPGDPGLITVKALACISRSDVLIYDYLAAEAFLKHAPPHAELIYVGKKGGDHTLSQDGINRLIIQKARSGGTVTRLKGGDPFIFGRGGEEAEELLKAGIAFEIVPGVTSAVAAPAYAGIPLTHRRYASRVTFVTGHEDPAKASSAIDWPSLAQGDGTLVFLMGVKNIAHIADRLMAHGRPSETPAAFVRWGTTARQTTLTGTLADIAEKVQASGLGAPAIIVVGGVVQLRQKLQWFEQRPLMGKRIVVTRAREQASGLVQTLTELGADCLECPTIKVAPPPDWQPLDAAIEKIAGYDWLVFTSVNGVTYFFQRLFDSGRDVRDLHHIKTAAIGPATAARLLNYGLRSDIVPRTYRAESVIAAFAAESVEGSRILLPRAAQARPVLPVELTRMGARVDEIAVYETRPDSGSVDTLLAELGSNSVDAVTFTSSSTVRNFKELLPPERFVSLMEGVRTISIGPITTDTARQLGISVNVTAAEYTIPGLVDAILQCFGEKRRGNDLA